MDCISQPLMRNDYRSLPNPYAFSGHTYVLVPNAAQSLSQT